MAEPLVYTLRQQYFSSIWAYKCPYCTYNYNNLITKRSFLVSERVSIYVRINERKSLVSLSFWLGSLGAASQGGSEAPEGAERRGIL